MLKYINSPIIGIDVANNFLIVTIFSPNDDIYRKSIRINHNLEGFNKLESEIKKTIYLFIHS